MARKKILIANWKLNHNRTTAGAFFGQVLPELPHDDKIDLVIAPVAPMLDFVSQKLVDQKELNVSAQNVFYRDSGAFTGEWSVEHLVELSVKYCIVGHSERRKYFGETDDDVARKASACLKHGITPIVCVGESTDERAQGQTKQVIERQIQMVIKDLPGPLESLIFAYEPIWAIGTGTTAQSGQIREVHQFIRMLIQKMMGQSVIENLRIVYGGSVTVENIKEIVSLPDVDGALVGGASLQAASFLSMVKALHDI